MNMVYIIARLLVIIGALNWLFVALGHNLVETLFGVGSTASQVIYILVGICGLIALVEFIQARTATSHTTKTTTYHN